MDSFFQEETSTQVTRGNREGKEGGGEEREEWKDGRREGIEDEGGGGTEASQ